MKCDNTNLGPEWDWLPDCLTRWTERAKEADSKFMRNVCRDWHNFFYHLPHDCEYMKNV